MDKDFNSLEQLMNYATRQIEIVMETIIAEFVEQKLRESIEENVFNVYFPAIYSRRSLTSSNQGLLNCWEHNTTTKGNTIKLIIENASEKVWSNSPKTQAELIEYGDPDSQGEAYLNPRPFFEPVKLELEKSGDLEKILKQSLDFLI